MMFYLEWFSTSLYEKIFSEWVGGCWQMVVVEGGVCDFDSWLLLFCLIMNFPEHRNRMLELE
jgi:hypothetical protein